MTRAHTREEFIKFFSQMEATDLTLSSYCDFEKINNNVEQVAMRLNQLNYLVGKEDLDSAIELLWHENPKAFEVMGILIAVRKKDKKKAIDSEGSIRLIYDYFQTLDDVKYFVKHSGLERVFKERQVKNLVDYVFGVEAGLDSHTRKNRGGEDTEIRIAKILSKNHIDYRKQVYSSEFPELSVLGTDKKRFDFVIESHGVTYVVEVNYYNSQGSKLNETARSYSELGPKINSIPGFEFVWITDGGGWRGSKNKLEEAFYIIPNVYNFATINDFIDKIK